MHTPRRIVAVALVTVTALATSQAISTTRDHTARDVVAAALTAAGGAEAIAALETIQFRDRMTGTSHDQSPTPDPPYEQITVEDAITVTPFGDRVRRHERAPTYQQTFLVDGHDAWVLNPVTHIASRALAGTSVDNVRRLTRRLPPLLLLEAAARTESARYIGRQDDAGRPHDVVEATFGDGLVLRLWIDAATRALTRHERTMIDASLGDIVEVTTYADFRPAGPVVIPRRYTVQRGSYLARTSEILDVVINGDLPADHFRLPAAATRREPEPPRPLHQVTRLSDRVYVLEQIAGQNFNVLFVAQDDGVVVIDAPEARPHQGISERVIATIGKTLPGKPIKYVVPTHHHSDHGGGLRAYLAAGVPVVTTAANAGYVRRLAAAPFAARPDAQARSPRPPVVETVTGRRRDIVANGHVIEVHDIGPEYHARENFAVWLPAERLLFLADLFETAYRPSAFWDGGGELGRILGIHKWPVEQIVTAHSRPRRFSELQRGPVR
jgi:glyoxylase-like metal-dependent hydrolase (beta-lactamase superfamily II)